MGKGSENGTEVEMESAVRIGLKLEKDMKGKVRMGDGSTNDKRG